MKGKWMVLVIFLLALAMIVAGGASLVAGLALTPTDLGFTYIQSGTIALSAGMVMMAIGLAVRVLDIALRRLATPEALRAEVQQETGPEESMTGAAASGRGSAGLATGAIVAGAAIAAGAALGAKTAGREDEPAVDGAENPDLATGNVPVDPAAISLDQLEMDLLGVTAKQPEPVVAQAETGAETEMDAAIVSDDAAQAETPADTPPETLAETRAEPAALGAEPEMAPGLIADPDFEAVLEREGPALAPLDTLDVIGAYDSGGTRFTMYSDGSVVAAGPEGERRFRSLEDLRAFIDAQA